jgi:PKHD-type hydroxylase
MEDEYSFTRLNSNLLVIYEASNVFSVPECLALSKYKFQLQDAYVNVGQKDKDVRRSKICWMPKNEYFWPVYDRILKFVSNANQNYYHFDITRLDERIQYTEYNETYKGHYGWHFDVGPGSRSCIRKLSIVVQLSDPGDYEGGDLQFSMDNDSILTAPKTQGSIVIFPSYLRHRVTPVTKGTRRSLVTWISGPPFR